MLIVANLLSHPVSTTAMIGVLAAGLVASLTLRKRIHRTAFDVWQQAISTSRCVPLEPGQPKSFNVAAWRTWNAPGILLEKDAPLMYFNNRGTLKVSVERV